ncbi:hypothetical protein [Halioxenophilus sp. WMMB6]|uniref:extracellular catalytic domain type 2 short-chain-length polyhydroxyalkanoate depolymerase n=1 Tax=Halioxenophilus sp. WMMB6 TaxID=3073815 RepID=UPI00295EA13E|nr:hypothetical protein [Halioxenophilus sp. WMMB6]
MPNRAPLRFNALLFLLVNLLTANVLADTVHDSAQPLPALQVDLSDVSVSGLSSGAFMTVQLYVANSGIMTGAAVIAGGPYLCARSWELQANITTATTSCMNPLTAAVGPNTPALLQLTETLAANGSIDPISNLRNDHLYLFSGEADQVVTRLVMDQTYQYFLGLGLPAESIDYVTNVDAGHAFITNNGNENACDITQSPFINDCDLDQATQLLKQLYPDLKPAKKDKHKLSGDIVTFDQAEFIDSDYTSMSEDAFVYIPAQCYQGGCRLHVAIHGCLQGYKVIDDAYYTQTGYNPVADANNIVVLYPQVQPSSKEPFNPQGCWDFWGYSQPDSAEPDYYSKQAPQLKALRAMIDRLGQAVD